MSLFKQSPDRLILNGFELRFEQEMKKNSKIKELKDRIQTLTNRLDNEELAPAIRDELNGQRKKLIQDLNKLRKSKK